MVKRACVARGGMCGEREECMAKVVACMAGVGACMAGGMHGGGMHGVGACMVWGGMCGGGMHGREACGEGGHAWQVKRPLQQTVRILLE